MSCSGEGGFMPVFSLLYTLDGYRADGRLHAWMHGSSVGSLEDLELQGVLISISYEV